jgi:hypothetical protein
MPNESRKIHFPVRVIAKYFVSSVAWDVVIQNKVPNCGLLGCDILWYYTNVSEYRAISFFKVEICKVIDLLGYVSRLQGTYPLCSTEAGKDTETDEAFWAPEPFNAYSKLIYSRNVFVT